MEIIKNIKIKDLCLLIKDTLIIPDLHLGYEEFLNNKGYIFPKTQFKETKKRLKKILNGLKLKKIILIGDIKHEFDKISNTEWRHILNLLNFLSKYTPEIILIKGNHDNQLQPIAKKSNLKIVNNYKLNNIFICHGDKIPKTKEFENSKTIIIGHEHAAITLKHNMRNEKFKCFLKGKYENKNLIVMPSFNLMTEGRDLLTEEPISPFLKQNFNDFKVYIVDKNILDFGKIKDLQKLE